MKTLRHGLAIGIERANNHFFLTLTCVGRLTHEDYKVMTPLINSALEGVQEAEIKVFIDATEFEGWDLRAAWDDFKLGLSHGHEFVKIAVVGHIRWQKVSAMIAAWFIAGEICFFDSSDDAFEWLGLTANNDASDVG